MFDMVFADMDQHRLVCCRFDIFVIVEPQFSAATLIAMLEARGRVLPCLEGQSFDWEALAARQSERVSEKMDRLFEYGIIIDWKAATGYSRERVSAMLDGSADTLPSPPLPVEASPSLPLSMEVVEYRQPVTPWLDRMGRMMLPITLDFARDAVACGTPGDAFTETLKALLEYDYSSQYINMLYTIRPRAAEKCVIAHHALVAPHLAWRFAAALGGTFPVVIDDYTVTIPFDGHERIAVFTEQILMPVGESALREVATCDNHSVLDWINADEKRVILFTAFKDAWHPRMTDEEVDLFLWGKEGVDPEDFDMRE